MRFALQAFVLSVALSLSCQNLGEDDCAMYRTCPGDLERAYREAELGACADCLKKSCPGKLQDCSTSYTCNYAVKCQMKSAPESYQDCLSELLSHHASAPNDPYGAWEGDPGDLDGCLKDHCVTACGRDRSDWACVDRQASTREVHPTTLQLSVQMLRLTTGDYSRIANVGVERCSDSTCVDAGVTDSEGELEIPLDRIAPAGLYFRLLDRDPNREFPFPPTFYYPSRLGTDERQPIAIYVVPSTIVELANRDLIQRNEVLQEAAQSVILVDACRDQETPTAAGVTLHVSGRSLPRCGQPDADGKRTSGPCIWYSKVDSPYPDLTRTVTSGWAAGIAALAPDTYKINVCDQNRGLVAQRAVRMEAGTLTIARTWPLTASEREDANADESGDPCASQDSSPMMPDSSAN